MNDVYTQEYSSEYQPETGSFMHGFTLGLVAGAAGYFLFATERGAKLRKQLVEEWQEAKKNLAEEGVIEHKNTSLREFIYGVFHKLSPGSLQEESHSGPVSQGLIADRRKASSRSIRVKREPQKKFKGV